MKYSFVADFDTLEELQSFAASLGGGGTKKKTRSTQKPEEKDTLGDDGLGDGLGDDGLGDGGNEFENEFETPKPKELLDQIREKASTLAKAGKKEAVHALMAKAKVAGLGDLPKEKHELFLKALNKL